MSHSYKKTPITRPYNSSKEYKTIDNRKYRRIIKYLINLGIYNNLPRFREISSNWDWPNDGQKWYNGYGTLVRK